MVVGSSNVGRGLAALVVGSVFGILVLFLIVLAIGNPIAQFGSLYLSVLYSLVVYVPVAIVCVLALRKAGRY